MQTDLYVAPLQYGDKHQINVAKQISTHSRNMQWGNFHVSMFGVLWIGWGLQFGN